MIATKVAVWQRSARPKALNKIRARKKTALKDRKRKKYKDCDCNKCKYKGKKNRAKKRKCAECKVKKPSKGSCFVGETLVWLKDRSRWAIKNIRLQEQVLTWRVEDYDFLDENSQVGVKVREEIEVSFVAEGVDGLRTEIELSRPREWLDEQKVGGVGDIVDLNLPEVSVTGVFQVVSLGRPKLVRRVSGFGRVTGLFRFSVGDIWELRTRGNEDTLRGTATHPIWSVDAKTWVPLGKLKSGEQVQTITGTAIVERVERIHEEPVYNIEVEGDHCYRVGEQGLLVHNASVGEGEVTGLYCDCEDVYQNIHIPPCEEVPRRQSGNPASACVACNSHLPCPDCRDWGGRAATPPRRYFGPDGQRHYQCSPGGTKTTWDATKHVSIVCGLCCQQHGTAPNIRVFIARACSCAGVPG